MQILNLVNKYKWWIIVILVHILINLYYIKIHNYVDNFVCKNEMNIQYCAESNYFKDNYKQYSKFMLKNYDNENLIKNEIFSENFTQILKVCEITKDCNLSKSDFDKYQRNRQLCSTYYKFCKIEYLFYQYNNSLLLVKPGFREYLFKNF